jgi:uncharacterized protein YdeI (BOF family)
VNSRNPSLWFLKSPRPPRQSPLAKLLRLVPKIAAGSLLLALLLGGCSRVTTIQDIKNRPRRWFSTVQLQGTVGDRVPLIGAEVYELKDPTGEIWVLTNDAQQSSPEGDPSLNTGEQVKIQGTIRIEEITIARQTTEEVYIEQQQLIEKQPP